jgi:hypothetical protein
MSAIQPNELTPASVLSVQKAALLAQPHPEQHRTDIKEYHIMVAQNISTETEHDVLTLCDRLRLYDMLANNTSFNPAELATLTRTHESDVRAWVEQQTAAGYLGVEDASVPAVARRYYLPEEYTTVLVKLTA